MKRTQASGSVAIDLSHVVAELERAATEAAVALSRSMAQLQQTMANLAASANRRTLNEAETIATLSCHLPAGLSTDALGDGHRIAQFQAQRLAEAGYALVAVSGPALEHAVATGDVLADFTHAAKVAAVAQANGVSTRGGTIHLDGYPLPEIHYVTPDTPTDTRTAEQRVCDHTQPCQCWFNQNAQPTADVSPMSASESEQRADVRLAQATSDRESDSWFEEPEQ